MTSGPSLEEYIEHVQNVTSFATVRQDTCFCDNILRKVSISSKVRNFKKCLENLVKLNCFN